MSNASALFRSLIVYGLCLPLAVTLGYLLADPLDMTTLTVVGILLFILVIPFLLRWHHVWLIAAWNMSAVLFFLPGRPTVWSTMAILSFAIAVLQYTINRNMKFLNVPLVARPLLLLTAVVLITMRLTGGIGLKVLGSSSYGGKNYISIFAAIVGYFALTSRRIPPKRALLYVSLYFFGTATVAIGDLPMVLPSGFNFLYLFFPLLSSGMLALQTGGEIVSSRVTGFGFLGLGLFGVMLARYNIRGIFLDAPNPWRGVAFLAAVCVCALSGFRSMLIMMVVTFLLLFYLERLHHSRLLPMMIIFMLVCGALLTAFANRLPFGIQRSLAFLPLNLDPMARVSAASTSEWRLEMWRQVLPQVSQYLILGKGYSFSARELAMLQDNNASNRDGLESTKLSGDYHNGPLSVLIPFGIFGMGAWLWFLWACLRVTYQNYQFGDPDYRKANTYLFAFCMAKVIIFFTIFGGLVTDLTSFAGLLGLSISLNGGVAKPAMVPQPKIVFNRFRLHPSVRRPANA